MVGVDKSAWADCDTIPSMAYESNSIFWVEVEKIVPNPFQPRREFNEDKLKELAESIRMYGVLQPLVVTKREIIGEDGAFSSQYELIAGERRLRASKLAGLSQVPVIIRSGEETELMKLELAIIENLQREDLNAVDRALAFRQLADQFGLSHSEVARKVGRSREYVSNSIRLLMLPETILSALRVSDISDGHARTLLMLNDRPEEQDVVFREILFKKLSVREVERIARKIATDKVRKKDLVISPDLIEIERQFTESLGTRVQIQKTDFGGKLTIDYFEAEDLQKILDLIHRGEIGTKKKDWSKTDEFRDIAAAAPLVPVSFPEDDVTDTVAAQESEDVTTEDSRTYASPVEGENLYTRHDSLEHAIDTLSDSEVTEMPVGVTEQNIDTVTAEPVSEVTIPHNEVTRTPEHGWYRTHASEPDTNVVAHEEVLERRDREFVSSTEDATRVRHDTPPQYEPNMPSPYEPTQQVSFSQHDEVNTPVNHTPVHAEGENLPQVSDSTTSEHASAQKAKKDEDDEDLYSIRNFTV